MKSCPHVEKCNLAISELYRTINPVLDKYAKKTNIKNSKYPVWSSKIYNIKLKDKFKGKFNNQ